MQILEGLLQQVGTGIVEVSFATKVYALNAIFVGTYFYLVLHHCHVILLAVEGKAIWGAWFTG
eukprot:2300451-Pleurochrysis_carterae.AAC.2